MDKHYIDADKLWEEIDNEDIYTDFESACIFKMVREKINNAPTADVEEVRHGKWEIKSEAGYAGLETDYYYCTFCDTWYDSVFVHACCAGMEENISVFPRCPACGAKMDKEKEE